MAKRIAAPSPTFLCDAELWNKCQSGISGARRRLLRELEEEEDSEFEDVDGYLYDSCRKMIDPDKAARSYNVGHSTISRLTG